MKALALALVLALGAVACGDGHHSQMPPDAGMMPPDSGPPPDGPPAATFTSFVIDLVQHQTSDSTPPVPYSTFQALPDPDTGNAGAYSSLFP